jgi:hypothetical protein
MSGYQELKLTIKNQKLFFFYEFFYAKIAAIANSLVELYWVTWLPIKVFNYEQSANIEQQN